MNKKIQKNSAMKFRAEFYCFICSCFWALRRLHIFILKFSDLYIGQVGNAQVQKAPMQCVKPSQVHRPHDAQDVTNTPGPHLMQIHLVRYSTTARYEKYSNIHLVRPIIHLVQIFTK